MTDPTEQEIRAWCEANPLPTLEDLYWQTWGEVFLGDFDTWREIHRRQREKWGSCKRSIMNSGLWGPGRPRPQKYIVQDDFEGVD